MIDFDFVAKDITKNKKELIIKLVDFSTMDVLLYWSKNKEVRKLQDEQWSPILHWLNDRFAMNLEKNDTLTAFDNKKARTSFEDILEKMSLKKLTAFYLAALDMKSPLLALALVENKITAEEAFNLTYLEELYQNSRWGEDKEAVEKRNQIKSELIEIEKYFKG